MNNFTLVQFVRILIAYSPILLTACGSIIFGLFSYYLAFQVLGNTRISKIIIWLALLAATFTVAALASMIIYQYLNPSIQGPDRINIRF